MKHLKLKSISKLLLCLTAILVLVAVSAVSFWAGQRRGEQIGKIREAVGIALVSYDICRKLDNNPSAERIADTRAWLLAHANIATHALIQNPKTLRMIYPDDSSIFRLIPTVEEYLKKELANVVIEDAFPEIEDMAGKLTVIRSRNSQIGNPPEAEQPLPEETADAPNSQAPDAGTALPEN